MSEAETISEDFLAILRCPACGSELDAGPGELRCRNVESCGLVYPVEDGIPHLVIDEGRRPGAGDAS